MRVPHPRISQLGTGALVLAALAVGQVLNDHLPTAERSARPFERPVEVGGTATMRSGDLTVTKLEGARSVGRHLEPIMTTPGVIVVVHFDFTPRKKRSSITYGDLRDAAGRVTSFSTTGQRSSVRCARGPVDLVSHCVAIAEGVPGGLPGARLALAPDANDTRFDDMAIVDLGITAATVKKWQAVEIIDVPAPTVEGLP